MAVRSGTYYTGTVTGQNGSLITAVKAICVTGEGWTILYESGNRIVIRTAGGNQFCVQIVDDGSTSAGAAREALVRAGESAADVNTLIDPWPFATYWTNGECCWRKSDTADTTARSYWAVADDRWLIMFIRHGTNAGELYYFGDLEPFWSGDVYATALAIRGADNNSGPSLMLTNSATTRYDVTLNTRVHLARRADGLVKFVNGIVISASSWAFGNYGSTARADYPGVSTNKLHMQPTFVNGVESQAFIGNVSAASMPRGAIPYLFEMLHGDVPSGFAEGDTFAASAYDPASEFIIFSVNNNFATGTSRIILQTAGTWDPGF